MVVRNITRKCTVIYHKCEEIDKLGARHNDEELRTKIKQTMVVYKKKRNETVYLHKENVKYCVSKSE